MADEVQALLGEMQKARANADEYRRASEQADVEWRDLLRRTAEAILARELGAHGATFQVIVEWSLDRGTEIGNGVANGISNGHVNADRKRSTARPPKRGVNSRKRGAGANPKAKPAGRVRRSAEDIEADIDRLVEHLRSKGKSGDKAEGIKRALGIPDSRWQPTITPALKSGRVTKKGEKRSTTYYAR